MYERLLDKNNEPSLEYIKKYVGSESYERLLKFEDYLRANYHLFREIRFPFGNNYGWSYKYSHKSTHLCYVFFENGAFTVTIQVGDKQVHLVEDTLFSLSQKAKELWETRYPCGNHGGWVHFRVLNDEDMLDVLKLVIAKKKPLR